MVFSKRKLCEANKSENLAACESISTLLPTVVA